MLAILGFLYFKQFFCWRAVLLRSNKKTLLGVKILFGLDWSVRNNDEDDFKKIGNTGNSMEHY